MEYKRIISVTGMPGLFELAASKNDGAIVKALEDGSTKFVSSRGHNFSHLESIEVYTHHGNENLVEIFKAMQASPEALPSDKDVAAVNSYFEKVYPTLDSDRVYASDKKKMVKWYNILKAAGVALTKEEAPFTSPNGGENGEEISEEAKATNTEAEAAVPSPS